jgi:hypothetical protein
MSCGAAHKADWIEPRAARRLGVRARPDQRSSGALSFWKRQSLSTGLD